jgi:hypothetical protein
MDKYRKKLDEKYVTKEEPKKAESKLQDELLPTAKT